MPNKPLSTAEALAQASPGTKDGDRRPAHRRHSPRLQQCPHRHHRHDRDSRRRPLPTGRSLAAVAKADGRRTASRGADLAAHLLAFARDQPSPPREVDVNACCFSMRPRLLRPTLGGQIEICSMPATDVPVVRVDPSRLMTAILDLAIAARDATPQGDRLILESRSLAAGESYACAGREIASGDSQVAIAAGASPAFRRSWPCRPDRPSPITCRT